MTTKEKQVNEADIDSVRRVAEIDGGGYANAAARLILELEKRVADLESRIATLEKRNEQE